MTPDMKRLCEAAANVELGPDADYLRDWQAEAVVRAVLTALREPSDGLREAMSDATPFPGQALNEMVDFILAEPAKA
jgi:hypothetical protein